MLVRTLLDFMIQEVVVVGFSSHIKIAGTNAGFKVMCPSIGLFVGGNFDCIVFVHLNWRR